MTTSPLTLTQGACSDCQAPRLHRNIYCGTHLRAYLHAFSVTPETFSPEYLAQILDHLTRGHHPDTETPTALYRYFDNEDVLLYIGISDKPEKRRRQHCDKSAWYRFADHWSVEWYAHREDAARQEWEAIDIEEPLFNRMGSTVDREGKTTAYLLANEALDLLRTAI